jgi:hypothetical protein
MTRQTALNQAIEALNLAAECGGELHLGVYAEAKQKLEAMVRAVVECGVKMDSDERAPEGDDYNQLMSILAINY